MNTCKSCGAPGDVDSVHAVWKCKYCGTSNYVDGYLDAYLEKIDVARVSSLMKIALASYESHDYESAEIQFRSALEEDAANYEAWAYRALALAHTVNLQNLRDLPKRAHRYLLEAKANASESGADFIGAAEADVNERLIKEAIRSAERNLDKALKIEHGYSHDASYAALKAAPKAADSLSDLQLALELECTNVTLMTEVCVLIQTVCDRYDLRDHSAFSMAKNYYSSVRKDFPNITEVLDEGFGERTHQQKTSKSGCVLPTSKLRLPRGHYKLAGMLKPGDQIATYHPATGSTGYSKVLLVVTKQVASTCEVEMGAENFTAASSHSLISDRGVTAIGALRPGDKVLSAGADNSILWREISGVRISNKPSPVIWYITDSAGFSMTDGLVTSEYSWAPKAQQFLIIQLHAWRLLDLWFQWKRAALFVSSKIHVLRTLRKNHSLA